MNLARLSSCGVVAIGGGRSCRGWQGNICATWTPKAFSSPAADVPFQRLRITCLPRKVHILHASSSSAADVSSEGTSLGFDDVADEGGHADQDYSSSVVGDAGSVSGEEAQHGGKPGFVSFYNARKDSTEVQELKPAAYKGGGGSLLWLIGPLALVVSVVGPPLYLRRFFESILEDSLLTDFVILFCTEALFYVGVSLFLYISHLQRMLQAPPSARSYGGSLLPGRPPVGYRISMIISVALGVVLPAISFGVVWPWTGPAAAAALMPYLIGLAVQLVFEKFVIAKKSPVWSMVPITFQVYRLHQLNRAAQLVAGLLFSLKAVEATPETLAVNGSLQSILSVVQVLGILCLWSLGSFLMHHFPARPPQGDQAISVP